LADIECVDIGSAWPNIPVAGMLRTIRGKKESIFNTEKRGEGAEAAEKNKNGASRDTRSAAGRSAKDLKLLYGLCPFSPLLRIKNACLLKAPGAGRRMPRARAVRNASRIDRPIGTRAPDCARQTCQVRENRLDPAMPTEFRDGPQESRAT
jgi:hypothetical protein